MRALTLTAAAVMVLAGCSEEAPQQQQAAAPAAPEPGLYEAQFTVDNLRITDKSDAPATKLQQGAATTASGCVAADGSIDPSLFAEAGDQCRASSNYVRNGRISTQIECRRSGDQIMQSVNGTYSAEGLKGEVSTTTYLAGAGDYAMTRTFTARRTGECPAAGAGEAGGNAAG